MARIWRSFRSESGGYQPGRLVDRRVLRPTTSVRRPQIICDIDKTYLETEFGSWLKVARIAFEDADDKVTVPGAAEFLIAARWGDLNNLEAPEPNPLHFVSSSPPQLRAVLEEKLLLDGLDWDSETFKNQAYNLIHGRVDQLRQHVAYKSLALLELLASHATPAEIYLLGDSAESDAVIYLGVKLVCEGRLTPQGLRKYLEAAHVPSDIASKVADTAEPIRAHVRRILIRAVPGYAPNWPDAVRGHVIPFHNYLEPLLILINDGVVPNSVLWPFVRRLHNRHGVAIGTLRAILQGALDACLRGELAQVIGEVIAKLPASPCTEEPPTFADLGPPGDLGTEDELLALAETWAASLGEKLTPADSDAAPPELPGRRPDPKKK